MKKYFTVSFQCLGSVSCSNIAHAESAAEVESYYSKRYSWVSVSECSESDLETARLKGMPVVEVETTAETVTEFTEIKKEVIVDSETAAEQKRFYIENGFFPTWAEEHRQHSDNGLKEYSTGLRWEQYTNGTISREKAVELATRRAVRAIEKQTAEKLATLDRVAAAPELAFCSVSVEWVRSSTWGYNPHAEAHTNNGTFCGSASGYGYDKESAAIADAFNRSDSVLKALFTLKENGLRAGQTDESRTTCTGRTNGTICGYGAGYGAIPYFEGGVGSSCFWSILEKCGYTVHASHGKHSDFYQIEKETLIND